MGYKIANDNTFNYDITVRAMTELVSLLTEEVSYVKANRTKALASIFDRKVDIIKYLETQNNILASGNQICEILDTEQRSRLKKLAHEVQVAVEENNRELEKARYFNEQMIKSIVDIVASKTKMLDNCEAEGDSNKKTYI